VSFYFSGQERKIDVQGRLSTRYANPVNPIPQGVDATQNVFQWNRRITIGMKNEGVVMAVRTAKVTAGKKENRAEFPWPIDKGGF
jgi:hypothetical protein